LWYKSKQLKKRIDLTRRAGGRRPGAVFKAHRLLYHSTLGLRLIKKKKKTWSGAWLLPARHSLHWHCEWDQIVFFNCLDLHHKSLNSGQRQYKSRTCKRRFDPTLRAGSICCSPRGIPCTGTAGGIKSSSLTALMCTTSR